MKLQKGLLLIMLLLVVRFESVSQTQPRVIAQSGGTSLPRYFDPANGMTADQVVAYALSHNAELLASRSEVEAVRALVRQAALRPNPSLEIERKEQLGGSDNTSMVSGMWPLELGGRRSARVLVAQKETTVKEHLLADRERLLAAEVRNKFGAALADILKLGFTEDLIITTDRGFRLVAAKVKEGQTAPLEENIVLVEVNRIRSVRETNEGKVEVALLELRNLIGMKPEEPLRLKGDFDHLIEALPTVAIATLRREYTELAVRNEVATAFARYQRAARAAEIYRVGVREQASSNLKVIRQTYELGSKTLLDYIAEQRRFIELENGYIDTLLETYLSRVEIQRAASEPRLMAINTEVK